MDEVKRIDWEETRLWYWEIRIGDETYKWGRAKNWRQANKYLNRYEKEANKIVKHRNKSNSR